MSRTYRRISYDMLISWHDPGRLYFQMHGGHYRPNWKNQVPDGKQLTWDRPPLIRHGDICRRDWNDMGPTNPHKDGKCRRAADREAIRIELDDIEGADDNAASSIAVA